MTAILFAVFFFIDGALLLVFTGTMIWKAGKKSSTSTPLSLAPEFTVAAITFIGGMGLLLAAGYTISNDEAGRIGRIESALMNQHPLTYSALAAERVVQISPWQYPSPTPPIAMPQRIPRDVSIEEVEALVEQARQRLKEKKEEYLKKMSPEERQKWEANERLEEQPLEPTGSALEKIERERLSTEEPSA